MKVRVSSHHLTAAGMNLKKCRGVLRALEGHRSPPDAPNHHLRKNHADLPGGDRRMRTELGKRKLEGVSQQLHCPSFFSPHVARVETSRWLRLWLRILWFLLQEYFDGNHCNED